eukprot:GILJ01002109.1.p1 GENE.GILJ01002109.1~~GILJ01002109.1.p1  ORF type:complete len:168 (-),score=18.50 GILJ01002109.1:197-700(-)
MWCCSGRTKPDEDSKPLPVERQPSHKSGGGASYQAAPVIRKGDLYVPPQNQSKNGPVQVSPPIGMRVSTSGPSMASPPPPVRKDLSNPRIVSSSPMLSDSGSVSPRSGSGSAYKPRESVTPSPLTPRGSVQPNTTTSYIRDDEAAKYRESRRLSEFLSDMEALTRST